MKQILIIKLKFVKMQEKKYFVFYNNVFSFAFSCIYFKLLIKIYKDPIFIIKIKMKGWG